MQDAQEPINKEAAVDAEVKPEEKMDLTPEEIQKLLGKEKKLRHDRCVQRINDVLKKERCELDPITMLKRGRVTHQVDVLVLD